MKKKVIIMKNEKKKLCRNLERWLLPNNIVRNFLFCVARLKIVLQLIGLEGLVYCNTLLEGSVLQ